MALSTKRIETFSERTAKLIISIGIILGVLYTGLTLRFVTVQAFAEYKTENASELKEIRKELKSVAIPARAVCYKLNGNQAECDPQ
jgi:hypothetical protein